MSGEYEHLRRVIYGLSDQLMVFIPVCPVCGRFVRADDTVAVNGLEQLADQPNATCSKHGRVQMLFEGWFGADELEAGAHA